MKLRNKKTGEIVLSQTMRGELNTLGCDTLKDLQEWEEVGEYYIDPFGRIFPLEYVREEDIKTLKEIGNYFGTREEAEKAVKKLKALTRLKDKGFRFINWDLDADDEDINVLLSSKAYKGNQVYVFEEVLDLLFGGNE